MLGTSISKMRKLKVKFWFNLFGWYDMILDGQRIISIGSGGNNFPIDGFNGRVFLDVNKGKMYIILQGCVFCMDGVFTNDEKEYIIEHEEMFKDIDSFNTLREVVKL